MRRLTDVDIFGVVALVVIFVTLFPPFQLLWKLMYWLLPLMD